MPEQLVLEGFDPKPPTDRLFFALYPDAQTAQRISALARELKAAHGLRGRPLAASRFHVTLHFFGDHLGLPQALVDAATAAAAQLKCAPFYVVFDHAMSFSAHRRKRPFVLRGSDGGLAALMAFRRALGDAIERQGLGRLVDARFTPHVTLLYDELPLAPQPVEPVVWQVREFVLVDSLIGRTRHVPLARWALDG